MASGIDDVLAECLVQGPFGLATAIRQGRAIAAPLPPSVGIFLDELNGYTYLAFLEARSHRVPFNRRMVDEDVVATTAYLNEKKHIIPVAGTLRRRGEPLRYELFADHPVTMGAPVLVNGQLVGVVVGNNPQPARVVPIGIALQRIEFEELDADAKLALRHAEGIRRVALSAQIHMEHYVNALELLTNANVRQRVQDAARTKLVETDERPALFEIPQMSEHVRVAFDAALATRGNADLTTLEHLKAGALHVTDCSIIQALLASGVKPPKTIIAGYSSDAPTADTDPFDVHKYARALCTVLAAREVTPPVSVGLFAPWGAGKTSFMQAMSREFDAIAGIARNNPDSAYRRDIVQLWFNAWHYTEQNLIASLADAVFEGLDTALTLENKNAGPEQVDKAAFERRDLVNQLQATDTKAAESRQKLDNAQADVARIDREIDAINANERMLADAKQMGIGAAKDEAKRVAKSLGVPKERADELVKSIGSAWSVVRKLIKSPRWWAVMSLWIIAAIVIALLVRIPWASLLPIAGVAGHALKVIADWKKAREGVLAERLKEKETAEAAARAAAEELRRVDQEKALLQKRLDEKTPQSMADFIRERRTSGAYTQQLSIAAEAHRDFRRLSAYVKRPDVGIDRIVLYIDDLDRCPEEKVVEVLRAAHLLLAFDLFVVIIAVDSAFLLRSLGKYYSNPLNYLEKIIQIPFALDPMSKPGYEEFINGLTKAPVRVAPPSISSGTRPSVVEGGTPSVAATQPPPQQPASTPVVTSTPQPIEPNPEQLTFSDDEKKFMREQLHGLMSSPRNAKRFVNIYRLIRATLTNRELDALLDPKTKAYEPLMLLVALVTNEPDKAPAILASLQSSDAKWSDRDAAEFRNWIPIVSRYLIQTAG